MKKIFLITMLTMMTLFSSARNFYFSTSGSDTYTITQAQNQSTPWQT